MLEIPSMGIGVKGRAHVIMKRSWKLLLPAALLLPYIVICEYSSQIPDQTGSSGCKAPELTLNGTPVAVRQNANTDYSTLTEIKFLAQLPIPIVKHKSRMCKIKCIKGEWVGPLCQDVDQSDGRFHPVSRNCRLDLNGTNLLMSYENTTFRAWHGWLPHRSKIILRCDGLPGLYKFLGSSKLRCDDGDWDYSIPSCIATTSITEYNEKSPPTILVKLPNGSFAVDFDRNEVVIYPGSIVHLECLFRRRDGHPEWTWSTGQQHRLTGWAIAADEREWIYRMSIFYIKEEDSGQYTCTTPKGQKNTIDIRVEAVQCEKDLRNRTRYLSVQSEGNHVGHKILYSCPKGFRLLGSNSTECSTNGKWSADVPTCELIQCPAIETVDSHLIISEFNLSYGNEVQFRCSWGYVLQGAQKIFCQMNGQWSAPLPTCLEILCLPPIIPLNGYLIEDTNPGKYNVGSIVQFACNKRHALIGAETLICEETATWSNVPPHCKPQCEYPGSPSNGRVVPLKFWYEPGDRLEVLCEPGYVIPISMLIVCESSGQWSIEIPQCKNYTEI